MLNFKLDIRFFLVPFIICHLTFNPSFGQNKVIDSLQFALKNEKRDSSKCKLLKNLFYAYEDPVSKWRVTQERMQLVEKNLGQLTQPSLEYNFFMKQKAGCYSQLGFLSKDKGDLKGSVEYYRKGLEISEQTNNKLAIAIALDNLGALLKMQGNLTEALECFRKSILISEEINDKEGLAITWNNIAEIHNVRGDIPKTLECLNKSLKIREEIGNKEGVATGLNNIGIVYFDQGDTHKALEYYLKAVQIQMEIGNKQGYVNALFNTGVAYKKLDDLPKAMESTEKSLKLYEEIGDRMGVAWALNQLGSIYKEKGDLSKAMSNYNASLKMREESGDKQGMAVCLKNISLLYFTGQKYELGIEYAEKSMRLAAELGYPLNMKEAAYNLWLGYKAKGNSKKALENFELYIRMRDSINNESTRKASIKSQLKYEYEKQAAADSVAHAKESEIKNVELQRQSAEIRAKKNQQYALFGGLGLVIIFAGFMFNRFKVTQKQKIIIEHQKEIVEEQKKLVEEKQKEVMDSIRYARRIQLAQIPSEKRVSGMIKKLKKD